MIHKILEANKDLKSIEQTKWNLTVINIPLQDSFVLPVCTLLILYNTFDFVTCDKFLYYFYTILSFLFFTIDFLRADIFLLR